MFVLPTVTIAEGDRACSGFSHSFPRGRASLLLVLVFPIFLTAAADGVPFTNVESLAGVYGSSVAWGDYDNDGDLDILLTGTDGPNFIALVYQQESAGIFFMAFAGLTGVGNSSAAWGDYDRDGDLDILLTGATASSYISRVYRNDGACPFHDISASLPGVASSSAAWGDYDNDGDLDILLTGASASGSISRVYRNDGAGAFQDISAGLLGVSNSSVAWGDYDKDGDLDILLTGTSASGSISRVYRNDGAGAFQDISAGLLGVSSSSVAWGDQDNDGDLDFLLTGASASGPISRVYRNDGAGAFHDISAGLLAVPNSSVAWGDYDNDGDLDVLLTGGVSATNVNSRVYRNDGAGGFNDISAGLPGVAFSSVAWGDYDNDRDLDLVLTGYGGLQLGVISLVYRNETPTGNAAPSAPTNAASLRNGNQVTFSWTGATDDHTPTAALSYNLRIGTTPGGDQILPAMAAPNGYRRVARLGNGQLRTSWTLTLPNGVYYWGVQAIDGAFLGSSFAGAQALSLEETPEGPNSFLLSPIRPNPFARSTVITYSLPSPGPLEIAIFDGAGRKVRALMSGSTDAGAHSVRWDGRDDGGTRLAAGVYFVRIEASGFTQARKVVLSD